MTLSPLGQVGKDFGQLLIILLDNKNSNKTFPFSLFDSILDVFIRVLTFVRSQNSNNLIDFLWKCFVWSLFVRVLCLVKNQNSNNLIDFNRNCFKPDRFVRVLLCGRKMWFCSQWAFLFCLSKKMRKMKCASNASGVEEARKTRGNFRFYTVRCAHTVAFYFCPSTKRHVERVMEKRLHALSCIRFFD